MGLEMPRRHHGAHTLAAQRAISRGEEVRSLEPPVSEQLGVERRYDATGAVPSLLLRDALEQVGEMRCVICRAIERCARLVRTLRAQVDVGSAHAPELQAARPADLVELEVPLVARVALVPAPDLH